MLDNVIMVRCQIRGYTTYCGVVPKWILQISLTENQISAELRLIEIIKDLEINEIIADIKAISYIYLRHLAYVKPLNHKEVNYERV